jgi:hypothetical protein
MLGWTILFALMSLGGMMRILTEPAASLFLKTATFLFAALFLISLLTGAVRRRTSG